jgi:hypothetical protein
MSKERDQAASDVYNATMRVLELVKLNYRQEAFWLEDPEDLRAVRPGLDEKLFDLAEAFSEFMHLSSDWKFDAEIEKLGKRIAALMRAKDVVKESDADILTDIAMELAEELEALLYRMGDCL